MKKLALLSIFLALPLIAQTPTDPKDFWAEFGQQAFVISQLKGQIQSAACYKQLASKGDEIVAAWRDFEKAQKDQGAAQVRKPSGETYASVVGQKVSAYQDFEKSCVQK